MLSVYRDFESITLSFLCGIASIILLFHEFNVNVVFSGFVIILIADGIALLIAMKTLILKISLIAHWRLILVFIYQIIASVLLGLFRNKVSTGIGVAGVVIWVFTWSIIHLFPLPYLPTPNGKFKRIGTSSFNLTLSNGSSLPVQCWFPIVSKKKPGSWLSRILRSNHAIMWTSGSTSEVLEMKLLLNALSKVYRIPKLILQHLVLARSHSEWCNGVDLGLPNKYPVAIFSHGLMGWRQYHHTACEKLASNGFIVFSIDHAPDSVIGRLHNNLQRSIPFDFFMPDDTYHPRMRLFYSNGMERRANDITLLLNHLESNSELSSKLDLSRVMIWGHSYGGGTVGLACSNDKRLIGGVMLDSWMFPMPDEHCKKGATVPILAISSEVWNLGKFQSPFRHEFLTKSASVPGWNFILKGTDHSNFSDVLHMGSKIILTKPDVLGATVDPNITMSMVEDILVVYLQCLYCHGSKLTSLINGESESQVSVSPDQFIRGLRSTHSELGINASIVDDEVYNRLSDSLIDALQAPQCYDTTVFNLVNNPEYMSRMNS